MFNKLKKNQREYNKHAQEEHARNNQSGVTVIPSGKDTLHDIRNQKAKAKSKVQAERVVAPATIIAGTLALKQTNRLKELNKQEHAESIRKAVQQKTARLAEGAAKKLKHAKQIRQEIKAEVPKSSIINKVNTSPKLDVQGKTDVITKLATHGTEIMGKYGPTAGLAASAIGAGLIAKRYLKKRKLKQ